VIRPFRSPASFSSLPTPEQIAENPELVPLHALEQALELTYRTLVSIYPDLDDPEVPYWAIDPSRTRQAAHRLVIAGAQLKARIEEYGAILDLERLTDANQPDEDLPF
jgi:hypothetical protein